MQMYALFKLVQIYHFSSSSNNTFKWISKSLMFKFGINFMILNLRKSWRNLRKKFTNREMQFFIS